jgi:hypothetical protein
MAASTAPTCAPKILDLGRTEAAHAPLSDTGRLVGKLRPVVRAAIGVVDRARHQFSTDNAVADQLVGDDLPGTLAVRSEQPPEESPGRLGVPACLQVHIDVRHRPDPPLATGIDADPQS